MKTLKDYKQEARERLEHKFLHDFKKKNVHPERGAEASGAFLEETLDRLLDEIEKAVVPPEREPFFFETSDFANGYFMGKKKVEAAFTRFKGESVPEGECACEEPHVSKRVKHVRKGEGNCHIV